MSSVEGREGQVAMGPYCVSKFGVISLTQTLAKELGPKNILANAICPGLVKTPLTGPLSDLYIGDKNISDQFGLKPLIERFAVPEDVANLALFLASDESSYITGQAINVCGGMQFY
jgi:NAD(P)-dependent dehydrogenase (short-subunit alcohol dehydrogenase family)